MTFAPHLDSNDASISHFDSMAIIKPKYPVLASPRSTRRNTLVAAGGATVGTTSTLKSSATPVSDIYAAIDLVPQIVENGGGISSTGDFLAGAVKALEGEKGVDVELLLKSDFSRLEHDAFVHDIKTMSVDQCLALNALLLKHLAQIQDERMISGVHTVSAAELKLGKF